MHLLLTFFNIFVVNILLSGDNALVIALASRNLPPQHQKMAMLLGSFGAVVSRIILTFIAVYLLQIPLLRIMGGFMLLRIAVKLISGEESPGEVVAKDSLWGAVQTIILADVVMSLDNVIAIASVANGNVVLIILSLLISTPVVIWGSKFIDLLMKKWPITVIMGAGILGWTAGEMIIEDKIIEPFLNPYGWTSWIVPAGLAVFVVLVGVLLSGRNVRKKVFAKEEDNLHKD